MGVPKNYGRLVIKVKSIRTDRFKPTGGLRLEKNEPRTKWSNFTRKSRVKKGIPHGMNLVPRSPGHDQRIYDLLSFVPSSSLRSVN